MNQLLQFQFVRKNINNNVLEKLVDSYEDENELPNNIGHKAISSSTLIPESMNYEIE